VPNKAKCSLEAIIEVSRQLLSQFDLHIESLKNEDITENKTILATTTSKNLKQIPISDEQLLELVAYRESLIVTFFETYTQEQLEAQLVYINEMVLLDQQLILKSKSHKQALATRVLKLKKSKKVSNLYKKY